MPVGGCASAVTAGPVGEGSDGHDGQGDDARLLCCSKVADGVSLVAAPPFWLGDARSHRGADVRDGMVVAFLRGFYQVPDRPMKQADRRRRSTAGGVIVNGSVGVEPGEWTNTEVCRSPR